LRDNGEKLWLICRCRDRSYQEVIRRRQSIVVHTCEKNAARPGASWPLLRSEKAVVRSAWPAAKSPGVGTEEQELHRFAETTAKLRKTAACCDDFLR
jgi:hypothetical protein